MKDREVTSLRLFPSTRDRLDEIGRRLGGHSRGLVVELLVALYGDQLGPDTAIPARLLMGNPRRSNRGATNSHAKRRKESR